MLALGVVLWHPGLQVKIHFHGRGKRALYVLAHGGLVAFAYHHLGYK